MCCLLASVTAAWYVLFCLTQVCSCAYWLLQSLTASAMLATICLALDRLVAASVAFTGCW